MMDMDGNGKDVSLRKGGAGTLKNRDVRDSRDVDALMHNASVTPDSAIMDILEDHDDDDDDEDGMGDDGGGQSEEDGS